jgi:hypothetical protein
MEDGGFVLRAEALTEISKRAFASRRSSFGCSEFMARIFGMVLSSVLELTCTKYC